MNSFNFIVFFKYFPLDITLFSTISTTLFRHISLLLIVFQEKL